MAARTSRQKPPVKDVPRRRIPGGSRLRSISIENVTDSSSEQEQEDGEREKE
ncbi:MAG: hypothetical protein HC903_03015 [Methylacidiphilales bacterium]|nr:hypothetical protein [Candidatus Methylacidiphilales bacterium]NJR14534.1 hypothetical protein [Calothrix sp. CSU_2_0]